MAIPLQQGQVFNMYNPQQYAETLVAIPLKQGQVFNVCRVRTICWQASRNPFEAGTSF